MDSSSQLFWCLYITSFFGAFVITRWLCRKVISIFHKKYLIGQAATSLINALARYHKGECYSRIKTDDGFNIFVIPPEYRVQLDRENNIYHISRSVDTA